MVTFNVPNTLRNRKLSETVAEVIEAVKAGKVVSIVNENDYAVSVVSVVENVKEKLASEGIDTFQANELQHVEVPVPANELTPLEKPKIHHYQIKLTTTISLKELDDISEEKTLQHNKAKKK